MNKSDVAGRVAASCGLSAEQATHAVDALITAIADELSRGGAVAVAGFGKFTVSRREARSGRNPATGEPLAIRASNSPKFAAAAALKKRVNA